MARRNLFTERQATMDEVMTCLTTMNTYPGTWKEAVARIVHAATYSRTSEAGSGERAKTWRTQMRDLEAAAQALLASKGPTNRLYEALAAAVPVV